MPKPGVHCLHPKPQPDPPIGLAAVAAEPAATRDDFCRVSEHHLIDVHVLPTLLISTVASFQSLGSPGHDDSSVDDPNLLGSLMRWAAEPGRALV